MNLTRPEKQQTYAPCTQSCMPCPREGQCCVYLQGQGIMRTCCFPLCFIWAVKSHHRWLSAYMVVQHDSQTHEGIAMSPYFPYTGYTNKHTNNNSFILLRLNSITSRWDPLQVHPGDMCVCMCVCTFLCSSSARESQSEMMFDNALINIAWFISLDY